MLSMAGALLLWKLAAPDADQNAATDAEKAEAAPRSGPSLRTRLLGGLGLALQLPILIVVPLLLLEGETPDAVSLVTALAMLVLPAIFAVLGLRLVLGLVEPRP
jgi:hypothetical protein